MRLFVGIGLPPEFAKELANAAQSLADIQRWSDLRVRWTSPENLHVTLQFLGEVKAERLEEVRSGLATVHANRLRLELNGLGSFARVGVLHAHVKQSPELLGLANDVTSAMERCGFEREPRPYTPHITLARAKGRISTSPKQANPAFFQAFWANEFRLYQSVTSRAGAHYKALGRYSLL